MDECELTAAARWLPVDDRGIPSGPSATVEGTPCDFRQPRPIGSTWLDHALTGLARDDDGRAWAYLAGHGTRVGLWAGQGYRWLQVFPATCRPGRRRKAVAVEPMTCPPNAFVTGDDLLVLQPGETVTHTWGIQIRTMNSFLAERSMVPPQRLFIRQSTTRKAPPESSGTPRCIEHGTRATAPTAAARTARTTARRDRQVLMSRTAPGDR